MAWPAGLVAATLMLAAPTSERRYLSGTDKDHTVAWDFMVTGGRRAGAWTTIPVPSNWELHGFGAYHYGGSAPRPNEQGRYRHRFEVPARVARPARLPRLRGLDDRHRGLDRRQAGRAEAPGRLLRVPLRRHAAGALRRRRHRLEVLVSKESSNASVNRAERDSDFWIFGGIFRPVYLEATPARAHRARRDRRAARRRVPRRRPPAAPRAARRRPGADRDARRPAGRRTTPLEDAATCHRARTGSRSRRASTMPDGLDGRDAEPVPGRASRSSAAASSLHTTSERFGFRTVELRPRDGLYVNGVEGAAQGRQPPQLLAGLGAHDEPRGQRARTRS